MINENVSPPVAVAPRILVCQKRSKTDDGKRRQKKENKKPVCEQTGYMYQFLFELFR